jgi:peptidoglycan/LPS O-acetylase OafA/YrhL
MKVEEPVNSSPPNRLPELDGIRGLAILSVLVWHFAVGQVKTTIGSPMAYTMKCLSLSWAGVDLFFVLSGFLIGEILMKNRESKNYYTTFFVRRSLRILPLFLLSASLFVVGLSLFKSSGNEGLEWLFSEAFPAWSYPTFLQNFFMASTGEMGPHWMAMTWSLAVEEQFYLVLPFLIRVIHPIRLPIALFLLVASAPAIRTALYLLHPHGDLSAYVLLPARWDALFLGVLGAWILRQKGLAQRLSSRKRWLIAAMMATGSTAALMLLSGHGIASAGMTYGGYTVIALFSLAFVLYVIVSPYGWVTRFLRNPALVWLGTTSFGIYLFHEPVAGLLHAFLRKRPPEIVTSEDALITLVALFLTLALAGLSSSRFERPFVQLGHRFRYDS